MPKIFILLSCATICSWTSAIAQSTYDEWVAASFDYLDADSTAAAAEALKQAMRLEPANPRNGLLLSNLGTLQRTMGELREAEISYSAAIALLADASSVLRSRAALYAELEQYDKAIDDWSTVLSANAADEEALYERGLCRLMSLDTLGARLDFEAIDHINPKSARSRLGMAYVYKAMQEWALAADLYDALIDRNPDNARLLMERAEVYYHSNRLAAALADVNRSIEINPREPLAYVLRSRIRYTRGDKEYARRDIQKARELGVADTVVADIVDHLR